MCVDLYIFIQRGTYSLYNLCVCKLAFCFSCHIVGVNKPQYSGTKFNNCGKPLCDRSMQFGDKLE